jgi:hypothetical protein
MVEFVCAWRWKIGFGFITFFQIQEPSESIFESSSIPCTQYSFPNAKDYVNTKLYDKLKIEVYVNIELNN